MNIEYIIKQFNICTKDVSLSKFGNGNINDTYLITSGENPKYILQKINCNVFKTPISLMDNIRIVTDHIKSKIGGQNNWKVYSIIKTKDNKDFFVTSNNDYWRVISFISETKTLTLINSKTEAYETGFGLGFFHNLISDIDPNILHETIPNFHITSLYLKHYDSISKTVLNLNQEALFAFNFISTFKKNVDALENAMNDQVLKHRVIHGDPKIDNILFNCETNKAISIIDLDTVMSGLIHFDLGDCIRSTCNNLGEEAGYNWKDVTFDLVSFEYLLKGYIEVANQFLTTADYAYIYDSIFIITFELGVRFFSDYLEGNVYFNKIDYKDHNLYRALTQFKLAEQINISKPVINNIVQKLQ